MVVNGIISSANAQELHAALTKAIRGMVLVNGHIVPTPVGGEGKYLVLSMGSDGKLHAGVPLGKPLVLDLITNKLRNSLPTETVVV